MPDTTTVAKGFVKQAIGSHTDTWGDILNSNFDMIDYSVGGAITIPIIGDTALTSVQAGNLVYNFTGTVGAGATITFPTYRGLAYIRNYTTGILACKMATGATVTLAPSTERLIFADGADFFAPNLGLATIGGTLTGPLTINDGTASSYPLRLISPAGANASTLYTVTGARQWAVGEAAAGGFFIQDVTASGAIRLSIDTSGNVSAPGAFLSNTHATLAGLALISGAAVNTGYTQVYDNAGVGNILLGGATDPQNYYRNTNHQFQSHTASPFATISAGGISLSAGSFNGNLSGNSSGTHTGPVNGNVNGNTNGTHTGPVNGGAISGTTISASGDITNSGVIASTHATLDGYGISYAGSNWISFQWNGSQVVVRVDNGAVAYPIASASSGSITSGLTVTGPVTGMPGVSIYVPSGNIQTLGAIQGNVGIFGGGGQGNWNAGGLNTVTVNGGGNAIYAPGGNIVAGASIISNLSGLQPGGGSWSNLSSDRRTKKSIEDYTRGLDVVTRLNPVTYQYNGKGETPDDGRVFTGLIADDAQDVMPEIIFKRMVKLDPDDAEDTEILSLNTTALTYAMLNAIKELSAKVAALEAGIRRV